LLFALLKKGDKNMEKATSLETLDDLELSARTQSQLRRKYRTLDEIIWHGRKAAFERNAYPEKAEKMPKVLLELADILDKSGFTRHDLTLRMFAVGRLYHALYPESGHFAERPREIDDFCVVDGDDLGQVDYRLGNERYENLSSLTELDIEACNVESEAEDRLSPSEFSIFKLLFGFTKDGRSHSRAEVARLYHCNPDRVRGCYPRIIRKLGYWDRFRPVLESVGPKTEVTRLSDIAELHLGIKVYNCLKRAGFNTVEEVVLYPVEKWIKVRNLGRIGLDDIREKLREHGFVLGMTLDAVENAEKLRKAGKIAISGLGLEPRIYDVLVSAGVSTIYDVMNLAGEDWAQVNGLMIRDLLRIEQKMHEAGYSNFKIFLK